MQSFPKLDETNITTFVYDFRNASVRLRWLELRDSILGGNVIRAKRIIIEIEFKRPVIALMYLFLVIGERSGKWNRFYWERNWRNLLLTSDLFSKFGGLLSDSFHSDSDWISSNRSAQCWFWFDFRPKHQQQRAFVSEERKGTLRFFKIALQIITL